LQTKRFIAVSAFNFFDTFLAFDLLAVGVKQGFFEVFVER
jgi:hypothetical protein